MQARLEAGLLPRLRPAAAPPPEHSAATDDEGTNHQQKCRVRRVIENAIVAEASGDRERAEDLLIDLRERLDDPEFETALETRPIGEIVATICVELGIPFDDRL